MRVFERIFYITDTLLPVILECDLVFLHDISLKLTVTEVTWIFRLGLGPPQKGTISTDAGHESVTYVRYLTIRSVMLVLPSSSV